MQRQRIILIDGDRIWRESCAQLMHTFGYSVKQAVSPRAALQLLQSWPAHVVIVGIDSYRRWRRGDPTVALVTRYACEIGIPTVVVSAMQEPLEGLSPEWLFGEDTHCCIQFVLKSNTPLLLSVVAVLLSSMSSQSWVTAQ
jgi:hypothetical protein